MAAESDYNETINFEDNDMTAEAQDIKVVCSPGDHTHGSSKVKLTDLSGFSWETRYYRGQLIAVHVLGKIFAYSMTIKGAGSISIVNKETGKRGRIKDLKKQVLDVSFALIPQQVILGCIDGEASVFIYDVNVESVPVCNLLLHIIHPSALTHPINNCRIIWCPYIPSHGEDVNTKDDPAKLFAFLNGTKAEVWDVCLVGKEYQFGKIPLQPKLREGYVEVEGHSEDITDASFSPDGTALATASLDGYVKFFQVYKVEDKAKHCLHEWVPHGGEPLSCLLFLDDIKEYVTADSRFWKFSVTGSKNNSEIKIWSCVTWLCIQTVRFHPSPASILPELFFKVGLDMSGQYLVASEINNRLLYVLQLEKNDADSVATVSSISEFLLPAPFLSFCIVDANMSKFRYSNSTEELYKDDIHDEYDENLSVNVIEINMCVIQPNKLQDCYIKFQPESIKNAENDLNLETLEKNTKEDVKDETEISAKLNELQNSVSLLMQQHSNQHHPQLNLMTPDAFSSPVHNSSPNSIRNSLGSGSILNKSLEKVNDTSVDNLIDFQRPQKDNFASGGSSPSREVQEILSLNNTSYSQEFFDTLSKIENDEAQKNDTVFVDNKEVVWPNIPLAKANEIVKEENRRQELRLGGGAGDDTEFLEEQKWNKVELQMITFRLNSLENLVREQNVHIQKLQHELKTQNKSLVADNVRAFSKEMELILAKNHLQMAKLSENLVNAQKTRERDIQDSLMTCMTQMLSKQLTDKLQNIVVHEVKHVVVPAVLGVFESLKHQLDIQYSQKLNSTDHLLKDNIAKMATSKAVVDSLSSSIVSIIKPSLEQCYKDMITSTMIPSWERICSTMFQQINETFTQGTKEYTASVESYMDRQRRVQDVGKDLVGKIQEISESMKGNSEKLSNNLVQELHRLIAISMNSMQDKLTRNLSEILGEQINQGFKNNAALLEDSVIHAVRSRAVTPSPHVIDTQVHLSLIQQLVAKGNIEMAFQQALSASDLNLVTYICERVDPQEVFKDGKCILQQHVLLSLIQQLSADLVHNTAVKHKYLEEALLYLEVLPITNEHIPIILKDLVRQIGIFLSTHPTNKHAKHMKMLLLATQSMLKS